MNSAIIVGRLTKDPVLKYDNKGAPYCDLRVSCKTKKNESIITVATRRRIAELCAHFLKKGRQVLALGPVKMTKTGVVLSADKVQFLSKK